MKIMKLLIIVIFLFFQVVHCHQAKIDSEEARHEETATYEHGNHEEEHSDEIVLSQEVFSEVGLKVAPLQKRKMIETRMFPGTVVAPPEGEACVGSLIGGRLVKISAKLGEQVQKGDPLCQVEAPEIGVAQSEYIRAMAHHQFAEKDLQRHKKLREEDINSEKTFLEKEAAFEAARAELAAAERTLQSIGFIRGEIDKMLVDHTTSGVLTLKSPIKGTVVRWSVRLGQRVEPENDLFHIVNLSRLWIKMSPYERDIVHIQKNQVVEVIPQSQPNRVLQGKIVQIGGEVEENTRTVDCYVEINNKENLLMPNQFVTCRVKVGKMTEPVLALPEEAVVLDQHGDYIAFVEHEPFHFLTREVQVGRTGNGLYEIVNGITEGERVIQNGAFFVKAEVDKGSFGHGHVH